MFFIFAVFVVFVTQELPMKTHLCLSSYNEPYFTLNCSTELQLLASPSYVQPSDGAGSYTVCGTPYPNYAEYKVVSCALGMGVSCFVPVHLPSSLHLLNSNCVLNLQQVT